MAGGICSGFLMLSLFLQILYIPAVKLQHTNCSQGNWGTNCSLTCGRGCDKGFCDNASGSCRCRNGWQDCSDGHYNRSNDCQNTCGAGCKGTCNITDGTCQCRPGWQPPLCQHCSDGHYNVSNDCLNTCARGCNGTCNITDGTCQCRPGWQIPLCQYCSNGRYNLSNDCQNTCGEGCHDTCNRTDGTCQCRPGWQLPLCQHCSDGHYSVSNDCLNTCGEGCNDTCNRTDGTCQCQPGWQPPLCQYAKSRDDDKEKKTLIWHLAGGIGGGVLIFLMGTFFGMCLRKCRGQQQHRWSIPPLADVWSPCDQSELQTRNYENVTSISSHEYEVLDNRDVSQKGSCTEVNRRGDYENTSVTMITSAHHNYQLPDPTAL